MNKSVKQAAVSKYSKLHAAGASEEEVKKAISETFKGEEVDEIYAAILTPEKEPEQPKEEKEADPNAVKKFKKFAASPVYKFRINEDTGEQERYLHEIKKKGDVISVHTIEQRHADELNSQVENSGFYYFG